MLDYTQRNKTAYNEIYPTGGKCDLEEYQRKYPRHLWSYITSRYITVKSFLYLKKSINFNYKNIDFQSIIDLQKLSAASKEIINKKPK